ncbi:MAG: sigma-70 family RNA polymerase sigma factor [Acidobacteriota bacterium]
MSLDAATSVDLVERIGAGDAGAEAELIERASPALRFLTRRFARHRADAEDLYQETLVLALEKIRRREVREPEHLGAFLRGLAKNLSTQKYRRRSFQAEKPGGDDLPDAADERQPGALGGLLREERLRLTRQLLDELQVPRDREVLFRYYIDEQDSASICEALGLSPDHLYRVLHRARERYRSLWNARRAAIAERRERMPTPRGPRDG